MGPNRPFQAEQGGPSAAPQSQLSPRNVDCRDHSSDAEHWHREEQDEAPKAGPIVDTVVSRLPGICQPTPTSRSLETERMPDVSLDRRASRDPFPQRRFSEAEFHGLDGRGGGPRTHNLTLIKRLL